MDDLNFIIDPEIDAKIREKCQQPNFGEIFFGWLTPKLRDKLITMINEYKTPYFIFLNGVQYEYGIGVDKNIEKALELYKKAAEFNESYALYRLYLINFYELEKFGLTRDRNREMYLLLKAMAFTDATIFFNNDTLYNIDIIYQIAYHLDIEDPGLEKVNQLLNNMPLENNNEVKFVEAMTLIKFNMDEEEIDLGIKMLSDLADDENYIEAIYKLAVLFSKPNDKYLKYKDSFKAEKYFRILEESNYYKSFNDFGLFLYNENRIEKCLEILKKGVDSGNFRCFFLYYDCFLSRFDFVNGNLGEIIDLLEYVRRDLITGNIFSFFEYFYTTKVLRKHFNIINEQYIEFEEEFLKIILNVYDNKQVILNNFAKGIVETEFLLSLGFVNYIRKMDYNFAEKLLKESFSLSNNLSYKRFCYSYIFKIRNKNKTDKLDKTKNKLFKIYNESMENNKLEDFSSSYFYFLAKIYESAWGCKKDNLRAYCYYLHASTARVKHLGTGTIIGYFRRYKAKMKLQKEAYQVLEKQLIQYKDDELAVTDDYSLCCICYENSKNVILFPCKHMLCNRCYEIIKSNEKCPICRSKIIIIK